MASDSSSVRACEWLDVWWSMQALIVRSLTPIFGGVCDHEADS